MELISIKAKKNGVAPRYYQNFDEKYGYGKFNNETRYGFIDNGILLQGMDAYYAFKQKFPEFPKVTLLVTNPFLFNGTMPYPNPLYKETNAADNAAAIASYIEFIRNNFTPMGLYKFPVIPDTLGWTWWKKVGSLYNTQIDVIVGKYNVNLKWVDTIDPNDVMLMGIVNYTMLTDDRDSALKAILGIH